MLDRLDAWIQTLGSAGYGALGLAAMVEYLFPPFPGDTVTLFGGVYAVRGNRPWAWVLVAITAGSIAGAALDYALGLKLARRWERGAASGHGSAAGARAMALAVKMRERGTALLLLNRFLPAVRGLLFVAAGMARLPFPRVMGLGALSALVWNGLLIAAGFAVGGNAERLERWLRQYNRAAYGILAAAAVALAVGWWRRRRAP